MYCFWDAASNLILYIALVKLNKMNESAAEEKEEQKEKSVPPSQQLPPLLKTLEDICCIIESPKRKERLTSLIIWCIIRIYGER